LILEKDDDDDGDDIAVPCRGLKLFSQHFQGKLLFFVVIMVSVNYL
jgi:hypothetical protein